MGYLQTLQLMVRAYKAARGVMPKGLDMLKLKQKARQKVIDAKKVINVDFSKGRKFYEEGIGDLIKQGKLFVGKAPKTKKIKEAVDPKLYEQMRIKEIMKQNKESAKRLEKKMNKEKDLGDRLKDYKGDPDAMREGGIISLANGGITNISDTYDNNPTLQAQYPNKQDYLDLFTQQTTTTTPQTDTITQSTTSTIAPINPIKPIIPLPESGGGDEGPRPKSFDKGYSSANFGLGPNKDVVDYEAEAYGIGRTPLGTASQIITGIPSLSKMAFQFVKGAGESLADRFRKSADAKRLADRIAAEQEKARLADELARQMNAAYYDNPGAAFTGGRYDGASSRSEYESNPTGFSGSS